MGFPFSQHSRVHDCHHLFSVLNALDLASGMCLPLSLSSSGCSPFPCCPAQLDLSKANLVSCPVHDTLTFSLPAT